MWRAVRKDPDGYTEALRSGAISSWTGDLVNDSDEQVEESEESEEEEPDETEIETREYNPRARDFRFLNL